MDVDVDVDVDVDAPRATRTNSATSSSFVRGIHQDPGTEESAVLAHKKLDVYRCALEFLTIAIRIEMCR